MRLARLFLVRSFPTVIIYQRPGIQLKVQHIKARQGFAAW
jgi:hypothetical protein